jgi:peroxiredoxin/tetratricopeptide (TPR) repeat protein
MMKRLLAAGGFSAAILTAQAAPASAQTTPAVPPQLPPGALTGPQVGQPAPSFSLTTLDGKTVSLDSYRGKTLIVNVWATWCPPCRLETPDLLSAYARLHKDGVEFLGVDDTEQAPIVRAFVADKNVPYPQAIDSARSFTDAYDVRYFPTTFVIDAQGVIRARHIDQVTPALLASFVDSAKAGQNVALQTPQQAKIDALLTNSNVTFGSDAASVDAAAKKVNEIIDKAEEYVDESDAAKGNAVDFLRTRTEEAALRDRAIAALAPVAATPAQTALLALMRGDAARDREDWSEALTQYDAVLAINAKDQDALSGVAFVAAPLKDYGRVVSADEKLVGMNPDSVDALIELGVAYTSAKQYALAAATNARATSLAMQQLAAKPSDPKLIRKVAVTHLEAGRTYAKAGETAKARDQFDQLIAWTLKLPKTSDRYAMYLEEAQEALVALDLSGPNAATSVSLTPWTGADLPGSVPNTIKYRLVVAGQAGRSVALHAAGVPKGWVASFCTDRVCAPFKVSVALPDSGVKVIEFQLVPPAAKAAAPKVYVIATDGARSATAST